jgi:hypothetical protein
MSNPPEELLRALGCDRDDSAVEVFVRTKTATLGIVANLVGGTAIFALFVYAGFFLCKPDTQPLTGVGLSAVGAIAFGACCFGVRDNLVHFRTTPDRVLVYERGLVWHTLVSGWEAARWADVNELYRVNLLKVVAEDSTLTIKFQNGKELTFAGELPNFHALADLCQRYAHRALYPVAKARFDAGDVLAFGPCKLSQKEVSVTFDVIGTSRKTLAELRCGTIRNGWLLLNHEVLEKCLSCPLSAIPNYTVFIALLPIVPEGWPVHYFE